VIAIAEFAGRLAAPVCPAAPSPDAQLWANNITGWVEWGVLAILGISVFASTGMLVWGRVTHHPKGARLGFDGLMICLVGAVLYVTGYTIITQIIGKGC
jgi:amino acid transporter